MTSRLATAVAVFALLFASGVAVGAVATDGPSPLVSTVTNTTNTTTTTTDGVTDTVTGGADATNDTLDNTTDATNDTLDNTTDATNDTLDNTTDATNDTLDNTTDATNDTLDNTTDTLDNTTDTLGGATGASDRTTDARGDGTATTSATAARSTTTAARTAVTTSATTGAGTDTCDCPGETTTAAGNASVPPSGSDGGGGEGGPGPASSTAALGATLLAGAATAHSDAVANAARTPGTVRAVRALLSSWWHRVLGVVGYSRYDDSDPLADDRRERIYATVRGSPGIGQSALADQTGIPLSSLRHHVDVLADENLVAGVRMDGQRRYFPAEMLGAGGEVAVEVGPVATAVLGAVSRHQPATGTELADALDRDPSTVSHHLSRLADRGLIERESDGRSVVNRVTATAERALADSPFAPEESAADD